MIISNSCAVLFCPRKYYGRGLCKYHHQQFRRTNKELPLKSKREKHGLVNSPEWICWSHIKARCYNPRDKAYENYGGRGITVCDRWLHSFNDFLTDVGYRPKGMTLDRINVNDSYEPGNVRWTTRHVQSVNRRIMKNNTSGFLGVSIKGNKFVVQIGIYGKVLYFGLYNTAEEAAYVRDQVVMQIHGSAAILNF